MRKTLLALLITLTALSSAAQSVLRQNGITYTLYTPENSTHYAEVTSNYLTVPSSVEILSTVTKDGINFPVITIADDAFLNCTNITSVTIPNSITKIGNNAFKGCKSMTSATIPNSVCLIGKSVFRGCATLSSIELPTSINEISEEAFYGCTALTSLIIPDNITKICDFGLCGTGLIDIVIPNTVKTIGKRALEKCHNLKSVQLPETLTEISNHLFYECFSLESITIPATVEKIGTAAFYKCHRLISVHIPDGVTDIEALAFDTCINLETIDFPESLKTIKNEAFRNCSKLREINYNTTEPLTGVKTIFEDETYLSAKLHVAPGGLEKSYSTIPWMYFANIAERNFTDAKHPTVDSYSNTPIEVYTISGSRLRIESTDKLPSGVYIIRQNGKTHKLTVK